MASITVDGIPEGLLALLRLAAAGNKRSLNSEVIVQLVRSAGASRGPVAAGEARPGTGCAGGHGCRCAARRAQARTVGWGGPLPGQEGGRQGPGHGPGTGGAKTPGPGSGSRPW